ncbi:MAG: hypothetical protein JO282_05670, partial [Alphaproteobacteria bacterium]|nr:hypothetical protein [Alphaproteobacteria bacterium]
NASETVNIPEWRRFISVNPEDSPAAYAITPTKGNTITIIASLSCTDPEVAFVEVRARNHVKGRAVNFINGSAGPVAFELIDPPTELGEVGVHDRTWEWEYRPDPHHAWQPFDSTRHRFYTILDIPGGPWEQAPFGPANSQMPWTEILDRACHWALGAASADMAAALVTRSVYALGRTIVTYDCPGGGSSHYSLPDFDGTAFLDRLRGGVGNGIYVNCSDCATIVASFANALGCELWESKMGWNFGLNDLLAIGSNVWQTACGWGSFSYHEVAWEAACNVNNGVYDACLRVNGGPDPTAPPYIPLQPEDLTFGNVGQLLYRDRLASPAGRPNCNPQPATRQRRAVI